VRAAIGHQELRTALAARNALRTRWPGAEVAVVERPAVEAILAEARRRAAGVIVVGSHGHGALGRLVLGSVSRGVVRRAPGAVLVVRRAPREVCRLAIGLDGSPASWQAVDLVARLAVPDGGTATLVAVVEPRRPVSTALLPRPLRAAAGRQLVALQDQRREAAARELERAAGRLARAGWAVGQEVRAGVPLVELLRATRASRADTLVLGARGAGGMEGLPLGSVAEGALARAPVPVLVVRGRR
jgi:nucleotide-binding universal stress UspA family protein